MAPGAPPAQGPVVPAFRHDPAKSVLRPADPSGFRWDREPIVCGYRLLTLDDPRGGAPIQVPVSATPAVVTGIGVIVASDDRRVRFFSQGLTKSFWERRLNGSVYASLVADVARERVVVATTKGQVVAMDLRGAVTWSADAGAPVYATPTVLPEADLLVVAAFHGRCVGLDLGTGEERFSVGLPVPWHAAYGGSASHRDPYASPAGTRDGNVVICCAEQALCLSPEGKQLWSKDIGTGIKASPVALHANGEVVVCPVDGRCLFLDEHSGVVRGEVFLGGKVVGSPAVSGGILAAGTVAGTTFGIDVGTREIAWTSGLGAPRDHTSYSLLPTGDFIVTAGRGNVLCLRREDGRFLWETSQVMGLPDHDPAMDITPVAGPDGRLYGASYSGVCYEFRFPPIRDEEGAR